MQTADTLLHRPPQGQPCVCVGMIFENSIAKNAIAHRVRCAAGRHHGDRQHGDLAQLVEHLLCKQEVGGSIPPVSTGPEAFPGYSPIDNKPAPVRSSVARNRPQALWGQYLRGAAGKHSRQRDFPGARSIAISEWSGTELRTQLGSGGSSPRCQLRGVAHKPGRPGERWR